jgi:hypothetical protein
VCGQIEADDGVQGENFCHRQRFSGATNVVDGLKWKSEAHAASSSFNWRGRYPEKENVARTIVDVGGLVRRSAKERCNCDDGDERE